MIEADGVTVISGSPERFLASVGDRIETRPIKGTRPRAPGRRRELAAAPTKDDAEHLMIVDLERNDLGRIAETGASASTSSATSSSCPRSTTRSRASARSRAPGTGYAGAAARDVPGGSITGAPKVRAMQLIDELEPARRGPYCGALGYFGARRRVRSRDRDPDRRDRGPRAARPRRRRHRRRLATRLPSSPRPRPRRPAGSLR